MFDEYLQRIRSLQDISRNIAVHNNRPVIGRLIRISRKVVLKLLRIPLLPLTNKQSAYNIAVADLLGAKIMQLRSDEAMRRSFGIAGRECMRSNDFADVACRLSAMYDSLRSEKVREA